MRGLLHTSHPQLAATLRWRNCWAQWSAVLYGGTRVKSARTLYREIGSKADYGGHLRAVQGFKYIGIFF